MELADARLSLLAEQLNECRTTATTLVIEIARDLPGTVSCDFVRPVEELAVNSITLHEPCHRIATLATAFLANNLEVVDSSQDIPEDQRTFTRHPITSITGVRLGGTSLARNPPAPQDLQRTRSNEACSSRTSPRCLPSHQRNSLIKSKHRAPHWSSTLRACSVAHSRAMSSIQSRTLPSSPYRSASMPR
jgi:hypothetical protein